MKFILKSPQDIKKLLIYLKFIEQTPEITEFVNKLLELSKIISKIRKSDKNVQIHYYNQFTDVFLKDASADIHYDLKLFTGSGETSGSKTSKKTTKIKYNVVLSRSARPDKRYKVVINDEDIIHFGSLGQNYTMHKDKKIKSAYIKRHKNNEKWTLEGIKTAGFWSKNLLWNKPTLRESLQSIRNKYKSVKIILSRN